ncbi:uncharacterized protein LOC117760561 [Hippoglossus hippoglossus]|uniref:uncharacterized protein LOC117760561 n=1 Tax=Hippoglossus hippoglossus TaxID=8267 RepID=UPI00148C2AAB|nr:uncharacterized protein LOC117760561 [Hippoglossus hippoglossus]
MEFCFGLFQTRGSKISWTSQMLLCSMLCMWTTVESWSYFYSNTTMDWEQARSWCRENYTDMVAIQNQDEIGHLNAWLPRAPTYYWIGIRKIDNVWTWVGTNKPLTAEATNWAQGEPNNGKQGRSGKREDCVEMYIKREMQTGKWNDEQCSKQKTALCYTAACKNDSCRYGDCVETINSHTCACFDGFYGEKCEEVVKCEQMEVTVPSKGSVNCTHKYGNFSFDSSCEYSCEEGYELSMSRPLRCTGSKEWSEQPPTCEAVQCPELTRPEGGSMNCFTPLGPSRYQSTCVFACDEGYVQAGSSSDTLQCEASGRWNASQPSCVAVQLPARPTLENGFVSCGPTDMKFIYRNTCSFSCGPGYHLVGLNTVTYTSAADWGENIPRCEAITCQDPEGAPHLITTCSSSSSELRLGSTCSFDCGAGFVLQGADTVLCSDDGRWSGAIPTCKAMECPAPEIPTSGRISCSLPLSSPASPETPHPLGMVCTFTCDEGHELEGAPSMECEDPGQWTSSPPTCTGINMCPLLEAPENGDINCSNSELVFNSQCSFTCTPEYSLDGHELLNCDRHGNWTGERPTCQASPSKMSAITSGVAAGGALLSGLSLVIWILKRLKQKKKDTFELSSNSDIEAPPQVYKNSFDSSSLAETTWGWTYHYSKKTMTWAKARQYCMTNYTDMVVFQSQEENDYLVSLLPNRTGTPYYWIGITKTHMNETWTWLGNNSTWIGNGSWAEKEPNNNHSTEFCVEIYINIGERRGKWNDEKCSNKKYPVCYQAVECPHLPQSDNGDMSQESVDIRQSLHHRVLIAALIVFTQDLSSGGGAQAWTYNYSITPNRRWLQASQWCQEHFTDMVTIQSQEEMDFINKLLPYNAKYYWIGVHRVDGVWIRVGTNETVPEDAQNWAPEEPDSIVGQDCVEIYFKRDKDIGMWNNEKCRTKKGTVCYSASCTQDSCSAHAECVETIGNYTCQCHLGFHGPRCEEVEQCPALNHTNSSGGRMNCSDPIASYSYNSTCEVRCDEGYELSGDGHIRCDHTGQWTASVPACTVKKCAPIFSPVMGNVTCMGTLESFSFGSWCDFTCQEGYYLSENSTLTCLASGQWSKPTPTCAVVQCNRLEAPPHASMQCQGPLGVYSYDSICTVQCEEGFELISTNKTKCSSQGHWSHALPLCQAKRCIPQNKPSHGSLSCSDPNGSDRFGSRCTSTCDEGFLLNGTSSTECTSLGTWNADIPRCLARRCPTLNSPTNGSLSCSRPHGEFRFGSRCTSACEEGFLLNGTADTECTSLGTWNADTPLCTAKRCPALNPPSHGSLSCSRPHGEFSFGSRCTSSCEEGFVLNGTSSAECTSVGTWNADIPRCQARRCPTLNSPTNGSLFCSRPHGEFSFGSRCTSSCEEGFVLNGTSSAECTSVGTWNADIPRCQARRCPTLNSPTNGSLSCSRPHGEFRFGSRCTSACEEGFLLNGTADTECTSLGTWNADTPLCTAKRCPALNPPSHGSLSCSKPHGEFRFGSRCTSSCDEGFLLNGTSSSECTSLGTWSTDLPHCLARPCPLLAEAPQHGRMNCSHPYSTFSYDSHCDFGCTEGFWLRGTPTVTCSSSGHWSRDLPTCELVQCEAIRALSLPLSVNCSHPLGNFSFGSQCLFTCKDRFSLNGTEVLLCSSTGFWSDGLPNCTEDLPVGAAMLMFTGVAATSLLVPLALIGLAVLILTRFKRRGNTARSDAPLWEERENPAFEF